jgi:BirA family biotin operon repressor/biotin-[acetyl-CoA-carboxylase] ligase
VESTQDYLRKVLKSRKEGDLVVSEIQTSGRGREGRSWYSDFGGLYLSITFTPKRTDVVDKIQFMTTSAIKHTLEVDFRLPECAIKEPNDVICHGKKIAGVLVDAEIEGKTAIAYIGIGVDLNNGGNWNREMREIATSYFLETGRKIEVDDFILSLLRELDKKYEKILLNK